MTDRPRNPSVLGPASEDLVAAANRLVAWCKYAAHSCPELAETYLALAEQFEADAARYRKELADGHR